MRHSFCYLFLFLFLCISGFSQSREETIKLLDTLNRQLDHAVVNKKGDFLKNHYADDFYFTHGTGKVDSKETWIKAVLDTAAHYLYRMHDSTAVELHGDIGIVRGKLYVQRKAPDRIRDYSLKYVRVFVYRDRRWQLISHYTTMEWIKS